jgi:solute carrier family 35 (adenosine 3'-phospho 5'-phosphosulfate transporter), member B2
MIKMPAPASLDQVFFKLAVNFLLYIAFITIFYLIVRFYLEEPLTSDGNQYRVLPTEVKENEDMDTQLDIEDVSVPDAINKADAIKTTVDNDEAQGTISPSRKASFLSINEWGEPEGTRTEVMQQLMFCAVGLVLTFGVWGIVQERILTQPYDGQYFQYSYGLVFINRLGGLILSACLMKIFKVEWYSSPLWEYSIPSCANMLSSWCQYEALKYVSFPTQMIAKSFKMLPTMLMGTFLHNKTYESFEYVSAGVVGFGLYLFIYSSENLEIGKNLLGDAQSLKGTWCGVVLLLLFLFFDAFNGQWQTRLFQINKELSPIQMMLITNAFSTAFALITLIHDDELIASMSFIANNVELMLHISLFCVCSTVGQIFIFYTIKKFGAVIFSIIMSVRILFSTLLSCLVYTHPITELSCIGMIVVFGAISFRIQKKLEGSPLIRWMNADVSKEIFHEWHEHVDM